MSPAFAHVWVEVFQAISVLVAMYCILQFYWQVRNSIAQYRPVWKVVAIKLVIFLSFWQTIMVSFLSSAGVISPSKLLGYPDIRVGVPAVLLCCEMALFSIFHLWAFTWTPYRKQVRIARQPSERGNDLFTTDYRGGFLGIRGLADALNFWDIVQDVGRSLKWVVAGEHARKSKTPNIASENRPLDLILSHVPTTGITQPSESESWVREEDEELLYHAQRTPLPYTPLAYKSALIES